MNQRKPLLRLLLILSIALLPSNAFSAKPTPPPPPADAGGDDLFLMQTSVSPNVILVMDNSDSMNHIEWHPAFDPDGGPYNGCAPAAAPFDDNTVYTYNSDDKNVTHCGHTRDIYGPDSPTYWDGRYLNWYFSAASDPYLSEIETAVAQIEGCTQAGGSGDFADKYRRTRFHATKQVLLDLLCVAESKNVRFGLANFRLSADAAGEDPNGGYILEDLGRANPNHAAELETSIKLAVTADETTLAETLFQMYSFWMSRDLAWIPLGEDGVTQFPRYQYDKFGNYQTLSTQWLEDAMEVPCEKAFIVVVSAGVPTRDDFDTDPASTSHGFSDFTNLIGDYNVDGETEVPGDVDETSWYMDDIAKYMYDKDFRPDLAGDQTIDTYAVGLATNSTADDYLRKTADVGNGLFFKVKDGDELAIALIAALNDIIEKAQSFTAATVPSARTFDGGDFYQSFFFPSGSSAFWEGHIRAWRITPDGSIHDKNDVCALDDPDVGECNSGPFKSTAQYFWDASDEVPQPASRSLWTSKIVAGTPTAVLFDDALTALDLDVTAFTAPPDPSPNSLLYPVKGSTALGAEGLADEIVAFGRGCFFGTGVTDPLLVATPAACASRPSRLGDIFHSNPIVVRQPPRQSTDTSYNDFKTAYSERARRIYAGSNAGFLEGIEAGTWQPSATPPSYTAGTGDELFGFMPWEARLNIKNLPVDSATNRTHYVDGSPQTADYWRHASATDGTKSADEWRTALLSGMREGGHQYFALDITNPSQIVGPAGTPGPGGKLPYPIYMWEFPREDDPNGDLALMGETWAQPVITRVRVKVGADDNGGLGYERWVAVVTAGYHESGDPNPNEVTGVVTPVYSATDVAGRAIFIIDLKSGEVLAEKKFDASASDAQTAMVYTNPTTAAVYDLDFDGYADMIFATDLGGHVYKWVITAMGEDRVNDASSLRTQPNWPFKLFFEAPVTTFGGDDYYKNLFFSPAATMHSNKLWLAFGSGERRSLQYQGDDPDPAVDDEDENNRFYVITDPDPWEQLATPLATVTELDLTDISNDEDGATFTNRGYYFKVQDGEKFVTNVEIFAGKVIAATFTPTPSADPCAARGDAALYVFDILDGKGYFETGGGTPVPTRSVSIGSGLPTDPKVSVGVGGQKNRVYIEKSGTDLWSAEQDDVPSGGRYIYWRELN